MLLVEQSKVASSRYVKKGTNVDGTSKTFASFSRDLKHETCLIRELDVGTLLKEVSESVQMWKVTQFQKTGNELLGISDSFLKTETRL